MIKTLLGTIWGVTTTLFLLFISLVTIAIAMVMDYNVLLYLGMILGGVALLTISIGLIKIVFKYLTYSLASSLFTGFSIMIIGILSWESILNPFIGFILGLFFSILFILSILRQLGKSAEKSSIMRTVFSHVSSYNAPIFFVRGVATTDIPIDKEYNDMVETLKKMGFSSMEAKEATIYTIQFTPNKPLEDRLIVALQYLGKKQADN